MARDRKTYLLIETPEGARCLVKSLSGHDGCTVIATRVPEQPGPHSRLSPEGKWVADSEAADRARLDGMNRTELVEEILRRAQGQPQTGSSGPKSGGRLRVD